MWKKLRIFPLFLVLTLCFSSCTQKPQLPEKTDFSAYAEVISVTQNADDTYTLQVKAALKNNAEQDWLLYGNPACWNEVFINDRGENKDLPLGSYTLKSGEELIEEKTVVLSKEETEHGTLHTETNFYIVYGKDKKQNYTVKSDPILLSEVKNSN